MRASDADREAVGDRLRDAHAEGRLTVEEFEERIEATLAAKTLGELAAVTQDLPAVSTAIEAPRDPVPAPARPYAGRGPVRRLWASWCSVTVICTGVWVATGLGDGHVGYPWPIWVAGPWGAVLLSRTLSGAERERPGRRDGERDHR
jgi:Domain of unknown function (DUF1707)